MNEEQWMRWMMMAGCASLIAGSAAAQTTADSAACGGAAAADSAAGAMIRIDARFTAETIRLNAPASARVVLPWCAPGTGVRVERQNLSERLEPGTTYRNGGIRIVITADAAIACRLAAALTSTAAGLDGVACGASPPAERGSPAPP